MTNHCKHCNAELDSDMPFCPICGEGVDMEPHHEEHCKYCGAVLKLGAKFCGRCTKPVYDDPEPIIENKYCERCGILLDAETATTFCKHCLEAIADDEKKPPRKPELIQRVSDRITSKISSSTSIGRVQRLLFIIFVVAFCITATGVAGHIVMNAAVSNIMANEMFSGDSELTSLMNNITNQTIVDVSICVIRNDRAGFTKLLNSLTNAASTIVGDPYGLGNLFMSSFGAELFSEARTMLIDEAGILWPVVCVVAFYKELLLLGLAILAISALTLYLTNYRISDVKRMKLFPVAVGGGTYSAAILIGAFVLVILMR